MCWLCCLARSVGQSLSPRVGGVGDKGDEVVPKVRSDYIGSDWIELHWIGLGQIGLNWIELDWVGIRKQLCMGVELMEQWLIGQWLEGVEM